MTTITVQATVSMGHRLPSYNGLCASPHGHNLRVIAELRVPLGEFLDFKLVQDTLKQVLEPFDHAMVLFEKDPLVKVLDEMDFRIIQLPAEPTTEVLAQVICELLTEHQLDVVQVTVHETDKYSATYRRP